MPIDASIYQGIGRGVEQFNPLAEFAQMQQLQGLQQQNKLAQLAFGDRERAIADANTQREAVKGFGSDTTANYNALLRTGNLGAAQGYQKNILEQQKTGVDISKTKAEATDKHFANYRAMLGTINDPQQAEQFVTASYNDPIIGPLLQKMGPLEQGIARLREAASTPQGFQQWRANAAIGIEKLAELAKTQNVNLGGNMVTQTVQPATGEVTQLASAPITQSADNLASNATSRANNAASVGVQQGALSNAQQRLAFDRDRDTLDRTKPKPKSAAMSAALQKELIESDDAVQGNASIKATLQEALKLNDTAYSGYRAKERALVRSNLPGESAQANATINLDNMMTGQALESLKAVFGGMPTEGERKILLDMQASADKTPSQRKVIIERAIEAADRRAKFAAKKAESIRGGTYLTDAPVMDSGPSPTTGSPDIDALVSKYAR